MAKIWPVYEGREPTIGRPWADLPLTEAIALREIEPKDRISDLNTTPRFGDVSRDLWYLGFKKVVLEVGSKEARLEKWAPGFFESSLGPKEALTRLIERAVSRELGKENIVRGEVEPAIDSEGSPALQATIVLAPGAISRFADKSVLDAIVRVQQLGETPTIIVTFVTEAELA